MKEGNAFNEYVT